MTTTPRTRHNLPDSQTVHRAELGNGLTVLVYETPHTSSVVMSGSLRAGAIYEDRAAQGGLSAMTATMLMQGTQNRDFDTLHDTLEAIGAEMGFSAGMHRVGFSAKSLAEDFPVLVDLLADTLRHPTFDETQFERLRGEQLTTFNYLRQDTGWQAERIFRETLYPPAHPYHYATRGTPETVQSFTPDALRAFHNAMYTPAGMVISVTGAVKAGQVIDAIRTNLGDWKPPTAPHNTPLPTFDGLSTGTYQGIHVPGKTQSDIVMGTIGPSRYASDFQAANMANSILGVFAMMGRIGERVREREGLAYYAGSQLSGGEGPGAWRINAGVDPSQVARTIDLCLDEVTRLVETPVDPEELDDNKSYFIGRLPLQLESNDGIAATLHVMERYGLGLDYLANYRETVEAITAQDVQAAAQRYLDPDRLVISVAGPGAG